jgi:mRNA-degrading endonuclease RelE of RelBE toxin-antitoxin system|tara:strand:- start:32 stop:355 length:324 start_codon:yes stop_codon:yes gene_type:complete
LSYRIEWVPEAARELKEMFAARDQQRIRAKIKDIANNLPQSLGLNTVNILREAYVPATAQDAYEVRIGSGYRAAFWLFPEEERLLVYLAGTHDYANSRFITASRSRG